MIATIITSVVAFASTNIDDVFVLTLLFSQVDHKMKRSDVVIGQYLGVFSLFGISILATFGLHFINMAHLNLLGIVPIFLGIKLGLMLKNAKAAPIKNTIDRSNKGLANKNYPTPNFKRVSDNRRQRRQQYWRLRAFV